MWIIGDSIVRRAAQTELAGDVSPDDNIDVHWYGWGGLRIQDVLSKVVYLLDSQDIPHWIVLHCGTNNLGQCSKGQMHRHLCAAIAGLKRLAPCTQLIWSEILPRHSIPPGYTVNILDKLRRRTNSVAGVLCGHQIIYHWENNNSEHLYAHDGLHLSHQGQLKFINNISFYLHFRDIFSKL